MCPANPAGTGGAPVVAGALPKLTVGTATNAPLTIPEEFTLRIFLQGNNPTFLVKDRFGGTFSTTLQGALNGIPYWNGSNEETANGVWLPPFLDFDGRTYSEVGGVNGLPFAFLLTDPSAKAPA
jgi:hypothetical protein